MVTGPDINVRPFHLMVHSPATTERIQIPNQANTIRCATGCRMADTTSETRHHRRLLVSPSPSGREKGLTSFVCVWIDFILSRAKAPLSQRSAVRDTNNRTQRAGRILKTLWYVGRI